MLSLIGGTVIKGTDDAEIDDKVFDIKSCSPWAFDKKWSRGYEHMRITMTLVMLANCMVMPQLRARILAVGSLLQKHWSSKGYACRCVCKRALLVKSKIEANVKAVNTNAPFKRCFEPEPDKWRGQRNGCKASCARPAKFCSYLGSCWPNAEYKPHPKSKAKDPPRYWYIED